MVFSNIENLDEFDRVSEAEQSFFDHFLLIQKILKKKVAHNISNNLNIV
jgi:hypothetical protein